MEEFEKISVFGLGYIGLPTAAMFASYKIEVVGVDINKTTVETINRGDIHIVEPDLDIAVHAAVTEGLLRATTTPETAQAFLIAVPTPFLGENHDPDLSFIKNAALAIASVLEKGNLVILESTSPVGATEQMADWLAEARPDLSFPQSHGESSDIRIAHCPERVLPGKVIRELVSNDRVIGGMTQRCSDMATRLYKTFVTGECVTASNTRVAEMAKLTENSFRDVNLAFANELSVICDRQEIDVWELISLANRHPRVNILQPGPGVGGHCIAVDPWFVVSSSPDEAKLIRTAREVNDEKPDWVLDRIEQAIKNFLDAHPTRNASDVRVACYGLTFKADIDDLRESPSLRIVEKLVAQNRYQILVTEPHLLEPPQHLQGIRFVSHEDALSGADIHVMLVAHSAFAVGQPASGTVLNFAAAWPPNGTSA